jgi:hypothetical protein
MTSKQKVYLIGSGVITRTIQLAYFDFVKSIYKDDIEIKDMRTEKTFIKVIEYKNIKVG